MPKVPVIKMICLPRERNSPIPAINHTLYASCSVGNPARRIGCLLHASRQNRGTRVTHYFNQNQRAITGRLSYNQAHEQPQFAIQMNVRSTIATQFEQVALEQKRKLTRLSDDLRLLDSGLDSLSFALIVMRLEEALGFDPFDESGETQFPVTFGDFVKLYEGKSK